MPSPIPPAIPFGIAIGLSAFLLFTLEPLVGRRLLPVFGGAAAVWATVLVFFQAILLLGYGYAHLSATRLRARTAAAVHVVLVAIAVVATAVGPRHLANIPISAFPGILGVLALLTIAVGPAGFVLGSTTPLLSAWYARVRATTDARQATTDPYWLYALSNGASLLALIAYPFVLEPEVGLAAQLDLWTSGLAVLAIALVLAAVASRPPAVSSPAAPLSPSSSGQISRARRARWLILAMIPAGLLSAVTNFVTTDLISAPLLWVIPLAVYLGSFVVAFSTLGRSRVVPFALALAPVAATVLWVPLGSSAEWPILPLLAIEYSGLAVLAVALHGRLAADRPPVAGLTGFYLTTSAGGVLGGALVAIVAPALFDGVWEYPLLIVAALAALAMTAEDTLPSTRRPVARMLAGAPRRVGPFAIVAAVLLALLGGGGAFDAATRWLVVGGLALLVGGGRWFLVATTSIVLVLATFVLPRAAIFRDRSFYGVVEVRRDASATTLVHGTTVHGAQYLDPARRGAPLGYYARSGPVGDVFRDLDDRILDGASIRVVGLGAGSLAMYSRPGDRLVFLELDPLIAAVSRDDRFFTYLRDAPGAVDVRIGDGRLLLEGEADASLDLVVLDAFSSDAIPVHLLTTEALGDAIRTLRPHGLLAIHLSNRYYDLSPVVAAAARDLGLTALEQQYEPTEAEAAQGAALSDWMVIARSPDVVEGLASRDWVPPRIADQAFTDDYADLLHHLRPGAW